MAQALKRIEKELKRFNEEEPKGFWAGPIDECDMFKWEASITGPENTPYEGGIFSFEIEFPKDYPFKPPRFKALTKIFHPNVCFNHCDKICLDIFYDAWTPSITISELLLSIQNSLIYPQMDKSLSNEASSLYKWDRELFNKKAKEWTEKYAYDDDYKIRDK